MGDRAVAVLRRMVPHTGVGDHTDARPHLDWRPFEGTVSGDGKVFGAAGRPARLLWKNRISLVKDLQVDRRSHHPTKILNSWPEKLDLCYNGAEQFRDQQSIELLGADPRWGSTILSWMFLFSQREDVDTL
jgi:hypothetical protein